ncbi:aminopeptidase [Microbacterium lacticum]
MTADDRLWQELAVQIADAREVAEGTRVGIVVTDASALPAVDALVRETYARGGLPQVVAAFEPYDVMAVQTASDAVLAEPSPVELWLTDWADVHVSFRAMVPPPAESPDAVRLAAQRRAKGVVSTARWQNTRWTLVRVPTPAWAAFIDVPLERLLGEFRSGVVADWDALRAAWTALCARLDATSTTRIRTTDTDLTLSTAGRRWVAFSGEANLPDGEIATAPVDDSAEGHILFPGQQWFAGTRIEDLRLEFSGGRCVGVRAAAGEEFATLLLDTDGGSRRIGELGIGTNAGVQTMTGDLLIDEKILGTVHIALGRAYPECGGVNESALHWDIVKDLRVPGGSLTCDDLALVEDGVPTPLLTRG